MMIQNIAERREHERYPLMLEGQVHVGQQAIDGTIIDISAGGAKAKLSTIMPDMENPVVGTVKLDLHGFGTFEGTIAWQDDEFVGIQFNEPHKVMVYLVLEWAELKRKKAS